MRLKGKKKAREKTSKKNKENVSKQNSVKTFIKLLVENAKKSGKKALVFDHNGKQTD